MKKQSIVTMLGIVLLAAGCATKSSYIGSWKSIGVPDGAEEQGIFAIVLTLHESGEYTGSYNDADGGILSSVRGRWEPGAQEGILLHLEEGQGPKESTAQLLDHDTFLGTDGQTSLKFSRQ
ncbi:hypothetical protein P4C99_20290 [Pontiellaceae bacterium B1224]|nr:hypothetical protein [Pontiellaceae bacterium B1224]